MTRENKEHSQNSQLSLRLMNTTVTALATIHGGVPYLHEYTHIKENINGTYFIIKDIASRH